MKIKFIKGTMGKWDDNYKILICKQYWEKYTQNHNKINDYLFFKQIFQ